jgi:hypothetical protein
MTRARHFDRTHFRQAHLKVVKRGSSPTLSLPSINHTSLKKVEEKRAYLETTLSSPLPMQKHSCGAEILGFSAESNHRPPEQHVTNFFEAVLS